MVDKLLELGISAHPIIGMSAFSACSGAAIIF
jgi:hypothetical protein